MRVLVTGGAGFIGSYVVTLLLKEGAEVRVLDSFVSGKRERLGAEVDIIEADIRDRDSLKNAMEGMTHVVHLAAQVGVPSSIEDPQYTHDVNVTGTKNVLEAALIAGVKRFVYASSAAVYGDHLELPKTEESPLQPKSPYAESKIANEIDARASGFPSVGLRFFNVYGPGQSWNHPYATVIPRWVEAIRAGKVITVYGDGSQTRDFIHVRDVARAIYDALTSEVTGIFNIASGVETSLNDLIQVVTDAKLGSLEVQREPPRRGDILRSVADISAARRAFDFAPSVGLREGISGLLTL